MNSPPCNTKSMGSNPSQNPTTSTPGIPTAPYIPIQITHPPAPFSGAPHHSHKTTVSTPHICPDTCNLCSPSHISLASAETFAHKGLPTSSSSSPSPLEFNDQIEAYQDEITHLQELLKQTQIQHEAVVVTLKQEMADLCHEHKEEIMKYTGQIVKQREEIRSEMTKEFSPYMAELHYLRKKDEDRENLRKRAENYEHLRKITYEQINQLLLSSSNKSTRLLVSLSFTKIPQSNSINPILEYLAFNPQIKFNLNDVFTNTRTRRIDQKFIANDDIDKNFSMHNLFSIYIFILSHLSTELISRQKPHNNVPTNVSIPQDRVNIQGPPITQDFLNYAGELIGIFNPFEHFRRYLNVLTLLVWDLGRHYMPDPIVGENETNILISMCYIYASIPFLRDSIVQEFVEIEDILSKALQDRSWFKEEWHGKSYSRGNTLAKLLSSMIYSFYMGVTKPWDFTLTSSIDNLFTTTEIPYPWEYPGMSREHLIGYIAHCHINWVQSNLHMNSNELTHNLSNVGPHTDGLVKYLDNCYNGFSIGNYVDSYHSPAPATTSDIFQLDLSKIHNTYSSSHSHMNSFTSLWAGLLKSDGVTPKFSVRCPVLSVPVTMSIAGFALHYFSQLSDPKHLDKYTPGLPQYPQNLKMFLTSYL